MHFYMKKQNKTKIVIILQVRRLIIGWGVVKKTKPPCLRFFVSSMSCVKQTNFEGNQQKKTISVFVQIDYYLLQSWWSCNNIYKVQSDLEKKEIIGLVIYELRFLNGFTYLHTFSFNFKQIASVWPLFFHLSIRIYCNLGTIKTLLIDKRTACLGDFNSK